MGLGLGLSEDDAVDVDGPPLRSLTAMFAAPRINRLRRGGSEI